MNALEYETFDLQEKLTHKGTKEWGMIRVAQRPNGAWITLPVMLAVGVQDGPTVLADGCNHGDEYEGTEGIIKTFQDLDVSEMKGNFIGVPAVNLEAFAQMCRFNATEYVPQDLNRIYPGSPKGSITNYLSHFYCETILKHCDALITLHGGGNYEYLEPVVLYCGEGDQTAKTSKEMAEVFGFKVLWKNTGYKAGSGIMDECAYEMGIPAITPEIGGQCTRMFQREEHKAMIQAGICNVLRYFGILEGEAKKTEDVLYVDIDYLYNRNGGIHTPVKKAMDEVKAGDTLSIITDVFGQEVDRLIAPFDGVVIGYWTYAVCHPHSWIYMVGKKVAPEEA